MLGARQSRDDGSNKDERAANRLPKAPVDGDAFKLQTLQTSPIGRAGPAHRELASLQSPDSRPPPTMPARLTPSPRRPTNPAGAAACQRSASAHHAGAGAGSREACASARALGPCPCSTSGGAATKRWLSNLPFAAQWAATSWPMTSITRTMGLPRRTPKCSPRSFSWSTCRRFRPQTVSHTAARAQAATCVCQGPR